MQASKVPDGSAAQHSCRERDVGWVGVHSKGVIGGMVTRDGGTPEMANHRIPEIYTSDRRFMPYGEAPPLPPRRLDCFLAAPPPRRRTLCCVSEFFWKIPRSSHGFGETNRCKPLRDGERVKEFSEEMLCGSLA
eukprot:3902935-Rhodomonas_salina.3